MRIDLSHDDTVEAVAIKQLYVRGQPIEYAWQDVEEVDFDCYKHAQTKGGDDELHNATIFSVEVGEKLVRQDWHDYYGVSRHRPPLGERIGDWFRNHFVSTKLA